MVGSDIGIDLGTASILVYIKGKGGFIHEKIHQKGNGSFIGSGTCCGHDLNNQIGK